MFRAFLVLALPASAFALTEPVPGARALPGGVELRLPFPAGDVARLAQGYGVHLHQNVDAAINANDHYALDLNFPDRPDRGRGAPVLAAASGTVRLAGPADGGWSTFGNRVVVELDFEDGARYQMLYAHLERVDVRAGQRVEQGDPLGVMGNSCFVADWCPMMVVHLHMAMYRGATVDGRGAYGGNAVVPEPIDGHEDLVAGMDLRSSNGAAPVPPLPPLDYALVEVVAPERMRVNERVRAQVRLRNTGSEPWTEAARVRLASRPDNGLVLLLAEPNGYCNGPADCRVFIHGEVLPGAEYTWDLEIAAPGGEPREELLGLWMVQDGNTFFGPPIERSIAIDPPCVCEDDQTEEEVCVDGGERIRICDGCVWGAWQGCQGERGCECEVGEMTGQSCEGDGSQLRECGADCQWGPWSLCREDEVHEPPEPDAEPADGAPADAAPADAAPADVAPVDAEPADASLPDAALADAVPADATRDAARPDAEAAPSQTAADANDDGGCATTPSDNPGPPLGFLALLALVVRLRPSR